MFRLSWTGDYNDPQAFLQIMESDNPSNMTGYSNEMVDDLMVRAGKTLDSAKRRRLLEYTERLVLNDQPVIPLYFYVGKHLVKPTVKGWTENVLNFHYSQHLELVQPWPRIMSAEREICAFLPPCGWCCRIRRAAISGCSERVGELIVCSYCAWSPSDH